MFSDTLKTPRGQYLLDLHRNPCAHFANVECPSTSFSFRCDEKQQDGEKNRVIPSVKKKKKHFSKLYETFTQSCNHERKLSQQNT